MKRTVLIGAACALAASATTAVASTSHILGHDGPTVPLKATCARAVVPAPGETLEFSVNVIGQQVHCIVHQPSFARCVQRLGPAPKVVKWHKDDWKGVDKLQQREQAIYDCSLGRF